MHQKLTKVQVGLTIMELLLLGISGRQKAEISIQMNAEFQGNNRTE